MATLAKHLGLFLVYGVLGALLVVAAGAVLYLENRDDLSLWHRVVLEEEYRADGAVRTFGDYLALEERLFAELDEKVADRVPTGPENLLNRYARGSLSSPDRWPRNWNRSFEFRPAAPRGGVLLLHGMSDSPYSLRALALRLRDRGMHVVGLRYPGHGTVPATLTRTRWEDMYAAVALAARHLGDAMGGRSYYVFGYSTGGPLALELALRAQGDDSLAVPAGLVFFSPAMGITPLAAITPWQARLGQMLGFEKVAWNSIEPEYDPFKYRSFPLNAAVQVWRLANHVSARLAEAEADGSLSKLPPILTFQSVVDATIEVGALVDVLYGRLPPPESPGGGDHALVAYDLNRSAAMEPLIAHDPRDVLAFLLADHGRRYAFSLVTNREDGSPGVVAITGVHRDAPASTCILDERWPEDVYSLTHIAPTFPPTDPLYGGAQAEPHPGISLGNVVLRGEGSALKISPAGLLRQTYNPFFEYQFVRIARFIGLPGQVAAGCVPAEA